MTNKFLVVVLAVLAWVSPSWAGDQPEGKKPAADPNAVTADDLSPPIPIVRGIVDNAVKEQQAIVLTPEQLEAIKQTTDKARQTEPFQYPNRFIAKPVVRSFYIDPDSTEQPRMIRLFMGTITSIVFSDTNGNPWYISATSFDCDQFDDGRSCEKGKAPPKPTNILNIQPKKPYAYGNVVVELDGLASSITFLLSTGESNENDLRIDARVSGRNPNAKPQAIVFDHMPEHDPYMGDILDGVPPQGAKRLSVGGGLAEGWLLRGSLYLRTRLSVLSPAFTNHVGSADGMHVYKFFSVVPSILASLNGKPMTLTVSGY